jgi:predicted pyridoxine 5'-phosphate oxidase superfamily flavin-nucleotide-binding protein
MGRHFAQIAFTPAVQAEQRRIGSRAAYARMEERGAEDAELGPAEAAFIAARDGFTIASVSETGWPYIQHRGGPPGFVRAIDPRTLAFAELGGNRQHITAGNLAGDDRVALFFLDHARRRRLKLLGHARLLHDAPELLAALTPPGREDLAQAVMTVEVAGFDWNCPQHITPRFTAEEWAAIAAAKPA